jgi:hypothetical protein
LREKKSLKMRVCVAGEFEAKWEFPMTSFAISLFEDFMVHVPEKHKDWNKQYKAFIEGTK